MTIIYIQNRMKSGAVYSDSDFLFAPHSPHDSHHIKAKKILEKIHFSTAYISTPIIQEAATLISQRIGKKESIRFLDIIHTGGFVIVYPDEYLIRKGEYIFKSIKSKNVSYADYISFAIMKERSIQWVLSFDIHFKKQGFKRVGTDGIPK